MTLEQLLKEHPDVVAQIKATAVSELTLEALKKGNAALFTQIIADAKPEVESPLEKQFVSLQAEVETLRTQNLRQERASIAGEMLAAADLRQLPKAGEIDLNARFKSQVEAAAMAAPSADAARSAVAALIEERRALIGATGPGGNTPNIQRRNHQPSTNVTNGIDSARARLGLS